MTAAARRRLHRDAQILALDPAKDCGWALASATGGKADILASGLVQLRENGWQGAGVRYLRLLRSLDRLNGMVREEGGSVALVVYERNQAFRSNDAARVYGGMQAIVMAWAEERSLAYMPMAVNRARRLTVGKARASKDDVQEWLRSRGFRRRMDHNEADAIVIAMAAAAECEPSAVRIRENAS